MTKRDLDPCWAGRSPPTASAPCSPPSVGGSPTTTYAENIGVMAATRVYSTAAYYVAAIVAILLGLVPEVRRARQRDPGGVLGGITVVLYGMIGLLGAKIWMENRVDFANPLNLVPIAAGIIIGIGNVTPDVQRRLLAQRHRARHDRRDRRLPRAARVRARPSHDAAAAAGRGHQQLRRRARIDAGGPNPPGQRARSPVPGKRRARRPAGPPRTATLPPCRNANSSPRPSSRTPTRPARPARASTTCSPGCAPSTRPCPPSGRGRGLQPRLPGGDRGGGPAHRRGAGSRTRGPRSRWTYGSRSAIWTRRPVRGPSRARLLASAAAVPPPSRRTAAAVRARGRQRAHRARPRARRRGRLS